MKVRFMPDSLSAQEVNAFLLLTEKFSIHTIQPVLSVEFSDGDLQKIPQILGRAVEIGLLASPENSYGIWGKDLMLHPELSLQMLSILAGSCAGIAACFHFGGLGYHLAENTKNPVLALQESFGPPFPQHLKDTTKAEPIPWETRLISENGNRFLQGSKHFVYEPSGSEHVLILARHETGWVWLKVPLETEGLQRVEITPRTGLRACRVEHLYFNNIPLKENNILPVSDSAERVNRMLSLNWLGLTAIALGTARGALKQAKAYVRQRYQGGGLIKDHDAIRGLLSAAEARIVSAEAFLKDWDGISAWNLTHVRRAAMFKWQAMELLSGAVTDALQTLGGYGYMEDYGMEKRLRDIAVLKSMAGAPLYLKRLISGLDEE